MNKNALALDGKAQAAIKIIVQPHRNGASAQPRRPSNSRVCGAGARWRAPECLGHLGCRPRCRKAPQPAAPNLRGERVPWLRETAPKLQGLERFDQKGITQPRRLFCIPGNGFVQLCLCWLQQADVHVRWAAAEYFAIIDKATALISCAGRRPAGHLLHGPRAYRARRRADPGCPRCVLPLACALRAAVGGLGAEGFGGGGHGGSGGVGRRLDYSEPKLRALACYGHRALQQGRRPRCACAGYS